MRQIAFFTADWNYELVGETLRGVSAYLDSHPDVTVRVFDCFGIDETVIDDACVYEIYHLADLDQYDGVIIQTHQIVKKDMLDELAGRVKARGIPAVSIGAPLAGLPELGTDDRHDFEELTRHVIEKHGARKLWFLKGAEEYDEDGEAVLRRKGFEDACGAAGIPKENIRMIDGNWKAYSGESAGHMLLAAAEKPDALICANDDMALGVLNILRDSPMRVPGDLIVTGYDGIFSASLCTPRLATVDRNFSDMARLAMDTVMDMIDGRTPPALSYNRTRLQMMGTCGCAGDEEAEVIRIKDRFYRQSQFLRSFYLTQDKMSAALARAESLQDVMAAVENHKDIFGAGDIRIYLDKKYYDSIVAAARGENRDLTEGSYSGTFMLTADSAKRAGARKQYKCYHVGQTQRRNSPSTLTSGRMTMYYPLRYGKVMVGVLMMRGTSAAAELNLHESIMNLIVLALETVRQRQIMNALNGRLNSLYVTDQLTGLYNRFGLERAGQPLFDRLVREGKSVRFLFVDIDEMKKINDQYGHEAGDRALRAAARILMEICEAEDFRMRYGGDEFIVFGEADGRDLKAKMKERLEAYNASSELPCPLSLSAGEFIRTPDNPLSLEKCLQGADACMYEIKKHKKHPGAPA